MTANVTDGSPKRFRAEDFVVPDCELEAATRKHLIEEFDFDDPIWGEHLDRAIGSRKLGVRRWLRRVVGVGRNARPQAEVRSGYEAHWNHAVSLDQFITSLNERVATVQWRQRGMLVALQLLRQVDLLFLMRVIEVLKPARVLEVGCGNGNIVLTLAGRFPDVRFSGVELTKSGVALASEVIRNDRLPSGIANNSPLPLRDTEAIRRVEVVVGDATSLPFPDGSFDLVYTRLALEQMEQVRAQAMKEIARVCGGALALIEPWQDYNKTDPGRSYVRRQGYFTGSLKSLEALGFKVIRATSDFPQKVQFGVGAAIAVRVGANHASPLRTSLACGSDYE